MSKEAELWRPSARWVRMGLIITIILVLVVLALVIWAITLLPLPSTPKLLIEVLVILLAALWIASRAGLLT